MRILLPNTTRFQSVVPEQPKAASVLGKPQEKGTETRSSIKINVNRKIKLPGAQASPPRDANDVVPEEADRYSLLRAKLKLQDAPVTGTEGQNNSGWPFFFKSMRYKKPFIINGYDLNEMFQEEMELKREREGVLMLDDNDDFKLDLDE